MSLLHLQTNPIAAAASRATVTTTNEELQLGAIKMDSRTGLDYIVENKDYVAKLGTALDSDNHTVKKQVFDLLSALCAHSPEGYNRAFETLEHYKVRTYGSACGLGRTLSRSVTASNRIASQSQQVTFIHKIRSRATHNYLLFTEQT